MIPFNIPPVTGKEKEYVLKAIENSKFSGDGDFNKKCVQWFKANLNCLGSNLTPSCTASLEMAFVVIDLLPGDEVIMPSFTFTSTANAVSLFGGVPVFVDIEADTLNLNLDLVENAITPKTKAIVPVHYAGVTCDMDRLNSIAKKHNLYVIEDAAQGMFATYKGRALGTLGDLGAISFHETKNIVCGEGGAFIINNPELLQKSEIVRDKGSNRQQFLRGEVDKYTWQDKGSSYLLSELSAAFLLAQLEEGHKITQKRLNHWDKYHKAFSDFEKKGVMKLPHIPADNKHNAHMFYAVFPSKEVLIKVHESLVAQEIKATTHYVPLHSAPAGLKYGRVGSSMKNSETLPYQLLRFPMYMDLPDEVFEKCHSVIKALT